MSQNTCFQAAFKVAAVYLSLPEQLACNIIYNPEQNTDLKHTQTEEFLCPTHS